MSPPAVVSAALPIAMRVSPHLTEALFGPYGLMVAGEIMRVGHDVTGQHDPETIMLSIQHSPTVEALMVSKLQAVLPQTFEAQPPAVPPRKPKRHGGSGWVKFLMVALVWLSFVGIIGLMLFREYDDPIVIMVLSTLAGSMLGILREIYQTFFGTPKKAEGDTVVEVQKALRQGSLRHRSLPVDGVPGPRTESALREFQTMHGLDPTGKIDDATRHKMGLT